MKCCNNLCPPSSLSPPPSRLYTGPLRSYSVLVRHAFLWWLSYVVMQPKWVHVPYLRITHAIVSKSLNKAFNTLRPDLVVRTLGMCGDTGQCGEPGKDG